jgi:hypothetical protein
MHSVHYCMHTVSRTQYSTVRSSTFRYIPPYCIVSYRFHALNINTTHTRKNWTVLYYTVLYSTVVGIIIQYSIVQYSNYYNSVQVKRRVKRWLVRVLLVVLLLLPLALLAPFNRSYYMRMHTHIVYCLRCYHSFISHDYYANGYLFTARSIPS